MNFEQTVQQWVLIDNQMKLYNEKIKELREKKNNIEEKLNIYANNNKLTDSFIGISDGKLKFINSKITSPLTFKYLEKSLGEIIKNPQQVTTILNYLKNNREYKIVNEIKRYYNN